MKRILAFILSVLMVLSVCVMTAGAASEEKDLYASVVSFDNNNLSKIKGVDATVKTVLEHKPSKVVDNQYYLYHAEISGSGKNTVKIDASSIDFTGHPVSFIVLDSTSDLSKLEVYPVFEGGATGDAAEFVTYNGVGYFKLPESTENLTGIKVSAGEVGYGYNMTEAFFCKNEYSAKFVVDNNVLPPETQQKKLIITETANATAIGLGDDTSVVHDFNGSKWPSIEVDENDRLYVGATCDRRAAHTDCFGTSLYVTSDDSGKTWSDPKIISRELPGASFGGFVYMGNGRMLTVEATGPISGLNPECIKDRRHGGWCDQELADSWDENGYPIGGKLGGFYSVWKHISETDPEIIEESGAYILESFDYGETWNTTPYKLRGEEGVDFTAEMQKWVDDHKVSDIRNHPRYYTSTPHGPILLSDGSLIVAGKAINDLYVRRNDVATYISKDEGKSWQYQSRLSIPAPYSTGDFHEPDVTETKDGVLIMGFRSFVVFNAFSYDKGNTWTTPMQTEMEGFPPGYTTLDNGNIVCTTNWRESPYSIFAYVSEDGGRTWSTRGDFKRSFVDSDIGYPDTAELSDGTLVTCYYGNHDIIQTTSWKYELIPVVNGGWVKSENGWVYFDAEGNMVKKQWQKDSKGWCYLDNNGFMVTAQSVKDTKGFCLVDESGYWVTKAGWQQVSGNWYYVGKDGYLVTNTWMKDSKGWCFLATNGIMRTNTSVQDTKGFCLVDKSGYWVTSVGWHKAGDNWYYVEKGGYLKTNGWMKDSKGWCYLDYEGIMKVSQTVKDSKGLCLIDGSGYWVTKAGWSMVDGDWYYVGKDGYLVTKGWMKDSKGWCYLDAGGVMLKKTAVKDSKGWAYVDESGYWVTTPGEYLIQNIYGGGIKRGVYNVGSDGYLIID